MPVSRTADYVGRVLGGRYRVVSPLGTGTSAHVFLAEEARTRRRVAVKILHSGLAGDAAFLQRFRIEAQAASVLSHPHIMKVHDWGDEADGPYLVLEYLGGGSLRRMLDAGELLSASQAASLGRQAAEALSYAHRRGVVHRDIKPGNLLFDEEGGLRLADFGLARALAEGAWTEPAGSLLGTARYASPEQAQGRPVDGRSDVYSLGLVLIEAVTGHVPFVADTTIATLMARVGSSVEVPPELGPVAHVVSRATASDSTERLDASSLAAELEAVARELPVPAPLLPLSPPSWLEPDRHDAAKAGSGRSDRASYASGEQAVGIDEYGMSDARPLPAPARSGQAGIADGPNPLGRRLRRSRRWVTATVAAVAALGVGVVLYGVFGLKLFVPSHTLPSIRGLTPAAADRRLASLHVGLRVVGRRYDGAVGAGLIASQDPPARASVKEGDAVVAVVSRGPRPVPVPSLANLDEVSAIATLAHAGLKANPSTAFSDTVPSGKVISWDPRSGTLLPGTTVNVVVSEGPAPRTIPNLVGDSPSDALSRLQGMGLATSTQQAFSNSVPAGQVSATSPAAGQSATLGQTVTVYVSKGPDLVTVPSAKGLSVPAATAALTQAGFQVANAFGPPTGTVFTTNPPAGTRAPRGSSVNLYTQ